MAKDNENKKDWSYKEEFKSEKTNKSGEKMLDVVVGAYQNGNKKFDKRLIIAEDREAEDIETYLDEIENYTMPL